jgi:Pin2-interacting protein X1
MGLSGRKTKQRIPNDPRNLGWSDGALYPCTFVAYPNIVRVGVDAARFGSAYLAKFGWDSASGLGADGDGRTTHLRVAQKLDALGIGAAHAKDPNGIAWKQNRDFERLLARLNGSDAGELEDMKVEGFNRATEEPNATEMSSTPDDPPEDEEEVERRARKELKREKRKREKEAVAGVDKKKKKPSGEADQQPTEVVVKATVEVNVQPLASTSAGPVRGYVKLRLYYVLYSCTLSHRARFVRSKRLALADPAAMSAVLGLAPNTSTSTTTSILPTHGLTPTSDSTDDAPALQLEKLTTSTKSVMDYFKEKLAAKSNSGFASMSASDPDPDDGAPRRGIGLGAVQTASTWDDQDAPSTRGLGIGFTRGTTGGGAAPTTLRSFTAASASAIPSRDAADATLNPIKKARRSETVLDEAVTSTTAVVAAVPPKLKKSKKSGLAATQAAATDEAQADGACVSLSPAKQEADVGVTESERKAAKRARKEHKRLAREQATAAD